MGNAVSGCEEATVALNAHISSLQARIGDLNDARQSKPPQAVVPSGPCFMFGVELECNRATHVTTGPVIGRVTDTSAVVMLEVSTPAKITCVACVVSKQYPQGRPVAHSTVTLPAGRPRSFLLTGLVPGHSHVVVFSGVNEADARARVGRFRTIGPGKPNLRLVAVAGDRPDAVGVAEYNLWEHLHEEVDANRIDVMLHVGCQVNLAPAFRDAWLALRQQEEAGLLLPGSARAAEAAEAAEEALRRVYRQSWNLPHTREALAGCSHIMMWSDDDVCPAFGDGGSGLVPEEALAVGPTPAPGPTALQIMLRAAQQVYREYQRQLFDPHGHGFPGMGGAAGTAGLYAATYDQLQADRRDLLHAAQGKDEEATKAWAAAQDAADQVSRWEAIHHANAADRAQAGTADADADASEQAAIDRTRRKLEGLEADARAAVAAALDARSAAHAKGVALLELAEVNGEQHWHRLGDAGILALDMRSSRVLPDGTPAPDNPLFGNRQLRMVKQALTDPDINFMVVVSEWGLVDGAAATAPGTAFGGSPAWQAGVGGGRTTHRWTEEDVWRARRAQRGADAGDALRMLRGLAEWKAAKPGRQVLMLTPGFGCAVTTVVKCRLRQGVPAWDGSGGGVPADTVVDMVQVGLAPLTTPARKFKAATEGTIPWDKDDAAAGEDDVRYFHCPADSRDRTFVCLRLKHGVHHRDRPPPRPPKPGEVFLRPFPSAVMLPDLDWASGSGLRPSPPAADALAALRGGAPDAAAHYVGWSGEPFTNLASDAVSALSPTKAAQAGLDDPPPPDRGPSARDLMDAFQEEEAKAVERPMDAGPSAQDLMAALSSGDLADWGEDAGEEEAKEARPAEEGPSVDDVLAAVGEGGLQPERRRPEVGFSFVMDEAPASTEDAPHVSTLGYWNDRAPNKWQQSRANKELQHVLESNAAAAAGEVPVPSEVHAGDEDELYGTDSYGSRYNNPVDGGTSRLIARFRGQVAAREADVRLLVGPVVGKVTASSAVVLLEVSHKAKVTLVLTDSISQHCVRLTRAMPARRPAPFVLTGLRPETRYEVRLEGVQHRLLHFGVVTTLPAAPTALNVVAVAGDVGVPPPAAEEPAVLPWGKPAVGVGQGDVGGASVVKRKGTAGIGFAADVWRELASLCSVPWHGPDVILRLGGQVDASAGFPSALLAIRRHERMVGLSLQAMPRRARAKALEAARDAIRDVYRQKWTAPFQRIVLSHTSTLPVWSGGDAGVPDPPVPGDATLRLLQGLARQVFREYQRALWASAGPSLATDDEWHLHQWGGIALFVGDEQCGRKEGGCSPWSAAQWEALHGCLANPSVKTVCVATATPPLTHSLSVQRRGMAWAGDADATVRLYRLLWEWKQARRGREAVVLAGSTSCGVSTLLRGTGGGGSIRQLAVGPLTSSVEPFTAGSRGSMQWRVAGGATTTLAYSHQAVLTRHNFGVVQCRLSARAVREAKDQVFTGDDVEDLVLSFPPLPDGLDADSYASESTLSDSDSEAERVTEAASSAHNLRRKKLKKATTHALVLEEEKQLPLCAPLKGCLPWKKKPAAGAGAGTSDGDDGDLPKVNSGLSIADVALTAKMTADKEEMEEAAREIAELEGEAKAEDTDGNTGAGTATTATTPPPGQAPAVAVDGVGAPDTFGEDTAVRAWLVETRRGAGESVRPRMRGVPKWIQRARHAARMTDVGRAARGGVYRLLLSTPDAVRNPLAPSTFADGVAATFGRFSEDMGGLVAEGGDARRMLATRVPEAVDFLYQLGVSPVLRSKLLPPTELLTLSALALVVKGTKALQGADGEGDPPPPDGDNPGGYLEMMATAAPLAEPDFLAVAQVVFAEAAAFHAVTLADAEVLSAGLT